MTPGPVIGVDIGGTTVRAGLVVGTRVHHVSSARTPASDGAEAVLDATGAVVTEVLRACAATGVSPVAVGVGSAGVIDPSRGRVVSATSALAGWAGTDIGAGLTARTGLPVRVVNDVHAHALGEAGARHGAGNGSLLLVAAGTGVGAGLVIGGRLVTGRCHVAGHLGHVPSVHAAGLACPCGATGHLEAIASGPAVLAAYHRNGGTSGAASTMELSTIARAGDPLALEAFRTAAEALGAALGGMVNVLDPDVVVVTGGLAGAGELWWPHLARALGHELVPAVRSVPLEPAGLGPDAALIGAAHLWRDPQEDES